MKNLKNVFLLTILLIAIVFIWLIPKTNGEKKTRYVRVYTRESAQSSEEKKDTTIENSTTTKSKKKRKGRNREIVQIDTLDGHIKMKDMKMSLFSRSRHFEPIVEIPNIDSITASSADTLKINNKR